MILEATGVVVCDACGDTIREGMGRAVVLHQRAYHVHAAKEGAIGRCGVVFVRSFERMLNELRSRARLPLLHEEDLR